MNFYLVVRPKFKNSSIPVYYYTFAKDENEAIFKVEMKWGEIDSGSYAREIKDLDQVVIATNYFG